MKLPKKIKVSSKTVTQIIIFLIPSNLAYHFITPSSYHSGILIDYLIPTIYLTDLLIIFLLFKKFPKIKLTHPLTIFLLLILPSIFLSPTVSIYKLLKLTLFSLFSLHLSQNYSLKKRLEILIRPLTYATLLQSILAISQWINQSSVMSYLPFGEQPYCDATPGIDKVTWLNGSLKIPPLGTFPHPNILGGFLAISLPLIFLQFKGSFFKNRKTKPHWSKLSLLTLILGLITLTLTFSLSAWLGLLLIGIPSLLFKFTPKKRKLSHTLIYSGLFLIFISFSFKLSPLTTESSFTRRSTLAKISLQMIKNHPLVGLGLNNFTPTMSKYGQIVANTRFLQPVHNIFLLFASESGLLGLSGFVYLIYSSLKHKTTPLTYSLLTLLFISLFDHYPLTIQQGMLLFFTLL